MHGAGLFFFLLFLLLLFAAIGWVVFTQVRARRAGLPPPSWRSYIPFMHGDSSSASNYPSPRSANPLEWIKEQFAKLSRNGRSARGAYEETAGEGGYSAGGANSRLRGRGVEDDAWDTRVGGNEDPYGPGPGGYYEEQELGLAPTPGLHGEPYGGGDYVQGGRTGYGSNERSAIRDPPTKALDPSPFGDQHEAPSLRSVSPRPEIDTGHVKGANSLDSQSGVNTSPTSTRRSMFREGL